MTQDSLSRSLDAEHAQLVALAEALPTDREARRAELVRAMSSYHTAIMHGDEPGRQAADRQARAVLVALTDGGRGYCAKGGAADMMQDECAATPGDVPLWAQRGEFVLTVEGMRVRVVVDPHFGSIMPAHIALYAVDQTSPFVSETGFRSCWQGDLIAGQTVDEAARVIIEQELRREGRKVIDPKYRTRDVPAWIDGGEVAAPAFYEDRGGQVAFAF